MTEADFIKNEHLEEENIKESMKFFADHSIKDAKRRKFHFMLAFCSCFVVVLFSLIINSVIEKGPVIFLRLAESYHGEIDGVITPPGYVKEGDKRHEIFLNYTRYEELYHGKYNIAPRKLTGVSVVSEKESNLYHSEETKKVWHTTFDKVTGLPKREEVYRQKFVDLPRRREIHDPQRDPPYLKVHNMLAFNTEQERKY